MIGRTVTRKHEASDGNVWSIAKGCACCFLYINLVSCNNLSYNHLLVPGILLSILLDFLHRLSCHLWIKMVLFLPSQSVHLLAPFFVLLHWLKLPVQCWEGLVRGDIFVLYLILVGKLKFLTLRMMLFVFKFSLLCFLLTKLELQLIKHFQML